MVCGGPGADGPIAVFAPARVDLSPGFTDVEPFCSEMPGLVVNVALDLGVEVTVGDEMAAAAVNSFVSRLCDAVTRRLHIVRPGVRLSMLSLPYGSGLGTSGALSVALAYALSLRAGSSVDRMDLVELACAAEREASLTGGTQDQLASMYGGAGLVYRHREQNRRIPIDTDLEALGKRLVLVYGSGSRNSGSIVEQVLTRPRAAVLAIINAMNRVGELLAESLRDGDYDRLASLMNESTGLLRALHPAIVGDDGLDQRLRALGASAVKPCGAGGSGAVWAALVDSALRADFVAAVTAAGLTVVPAAPSVGGAVRLGAGH